MPAIVRTAIILITLVVAAGTATLSGCGSSPSLREEPQAAAAPRFERAETLSDATSTARTVDAYKRDIALRITEVNSTHVYPGRPQALLRSIVVVKFSVDGNGRLLRSDIVRSNHDGATEATALATLRNTAPFPRPAAGLLHKGRLELAETWLFNADGRFQIRSVAQAQLAE